MTPDDELARRIVAEADGDEVRRVLAAAFGEGDVIARHIPLSAVPALVRAAWCDFLAIEAMSRGDQNAAALRQAAVALILEAAEVMEPIVTVPAPSTPEQIDRV